MPYQKEGNIHLERSISEVNDVVPFEERPRVRTTPRRDFNGFRGNESQRDFRSERKFQPQIPSGTPAPPPNTRYIGQ